jgi:hypothetical protein
VTDKIKESITINTFHFNCIHDNEQYEIKYPFNKELLKSTEDDFLTTLSKLKSSDSLDCYGFSNNSFKYHKEALAKPLSDLTNKCIQEGDFHKSLKIAKVMPLYKNSGSRTEMNDYRPLSITPIASKCVEDFLLGILSPYMRKNKIIHENQFGFTKGSSTETAAIHLLNQVFNYKDRSLLTAILFIDLHKAFDSVVHEILLKKLNKLQLPTEIINFFISYFSDRFQYVQIEDFKSPLFSVKAGVFQGSKLAALLFILYINNIFSLPLNGKIFLYADDIALVYGTKDPGELKKQMECDLILLNCWLENHFLLLNLKKTKYILFDGRAQFEFFLPGALDINLNNTKIERVSSFQYLGLIIDEKLTFDEHIKSITSRALSTIFAIKRIRPFITLNTARQLYFQHIHSILSYLNSSWNTANNTCIGRLAIIQKRALRVIFQKDPLSPSIELFSPQILPLKYLNLYQTLLLTYKLNNNLQRSNIEVLTRGQITGRNTRQSNLFDISRTYSASGSKDFFRRGFSEFNKLPYNIKNIRILGNYKIELRKYLYDIFIKEG